jgi:hypothetical protein
MSTSRDFAYFNNVVGKYDAMGIGDYLSMLCSMVGMFSRPDPVFWFVNQVSGSDTANTGNNPSSPFKTIQKAIDSAGTATDGQGDIVFLQSGNGTDYTGDTVGASLSNAYVYINKPDLSIIGLGPPNSIIIKPGAAATAGVIVLGASADRVRLANFTIDTTTALSGAIVTVSGAHYPTIENIIFQLTGDTGPTGVGIDFDAAAVNYPVIRNCDFYCGTLTIAGIRMKAGTTGGLIQGCRFISTINGSGTPCVDGINVKAGSFLTIDRCFINGGDKGTNYNMVDGIDIDAGVVHTQICDCLIGNCDNGVVDGGTDSCGETANEGWVDTSHS